MEKKKRRKYGLFIGTFIYVCLIVLVPVINILELNFHIKQYNITTTEMSGVLSAIEILIIIYLAFYYRRRGIIAGFILLSINLIVMIISFFRMKGNLAAVPGLAILIASIVSLLVMSRYLHKIYQHEQELEDIANHDLLTNLPNRRYLEERIKYLLSNETPFALAVIDLDNFKLINDSVGHSYGDDLLIEVTKKFKQHLNKQEILARMGGDEFTLIIPEMTDSLQVRNRIEELFSSIRDAIKVRNRTVYITASAGVALCPSDSNIFAKLYSFADAAMYQAKQNGKGKICFFDIQHMNTLERDIELEQRIRNALTNNLFSLNYQPQFYADTKELRGFEALIRLYCEDGTPISPAVFIPEAEKSDLIIEIDRWVLREAMHNFIYPYKLSINISARHLMNGELVHDIKEALTESSFPPEQLEIEITESMLIGSLTYAIEVLTELKKLGISLALDDFGTGYASLSYINQLPIDLLKVDKSFIDLLNKSEKNNEFVKTIIMLGHIIGVYIVAEGIEETEQLTFLQGCGCDFIQGFLWGSPMRLSEVSKLIQELS